LRALRWLETPLDPSSASFGLGSCTVYCGCFRPNPRSTSRDPQVVARPPRGIAYLGKQSNPARRLLLLLLLLLAR